MVASENPIRSFLPGMAWPAIPNDDGARMLALQFQFEQSQWWSPAQLRAHQLQQFQQILRNLGFTVKLKPFIQRSDGSAKGDWDVGIAIDVMAIAGSVDTVVLLSGDGDFDLLLEKVKTKFKVQADVYGVPALTANSLVDSASQFFPITEDLLM